MAENVNSSEIERAANLLRDGRLVAFPTETVYGLGANALDSEAVARIFAVKGRPSTSPLIVHVSSIEMAQSLVPQWPEVADRLARQFWPGPLTLVLKKRTDGQNTIPDIVTAGLPSVALRMPAHPVALALIRAAGVPLAAPSANRFTSISPTTVDHVRLGIGKEIDLILDGGPCDVGIESTVVSIAEAVPVLLRPGAVSRQMLEAVIGHLDSAGEEPVGAHPSPGMHRRHYSPRTALFLVGEGKLPGTGRGIYLRRGDAGQQSLAVEVRSMPNSPQEYAAALYLQLHEADAGGYDWIAVELPPSTPEWEAVHDRLRRAASSS